MIRNPEFAPRMAEAVAWFKALKSFDPSTVKPVLVTLPGGQFFGIQYDRAPGTSALYLPTYYSSFRHAIHPKSAAGRKRRNIRVAISCDGREWYVMYHGPVHSDGQPMIAIPEAMAEVYPFGPSVGLSQWPGAEPIDRYEARPYERIAMNLEAA